mmetsp:Transcript_60518/g.155940  ORF Transcript_60518/g.155940 Transcript_60518/m.155940 type:complete len:241 (-) Transcript_60518:74-796(-)
MGDSHHLVSSTRTEAAKYGTASSTTELALVLDVCTTFRLQRGLLCAARAGRSMPCLVHLEALLLALLLLRLDLLVLRQDVHAHVTEDVGRGAVLLLELGQGARIEEHLTLLALPDGVRTRPDVDLVFRDGAVQRADFLTIVDNVDVLVALGLGLLNPIPIVLLLLAVERTLRGSRLEVELLCLVAGPPVAARTHGDAVAGLRTGDGTGEGLPMVGSRAQQDNTEGKQQQATDTVAARHGL